MSTPEDYTEKLAEGEAGGPPMPENVEEVIQILGGLLSRSMDGMGINPEWVNQIAQHTYRVERVGKLDPNFELYDRLLDDDVAFSTFQQRRLDVISAEWEVEAGADDAQSQAAAEHLRGQLKGLKWDDICDKMLHAVWYGFSAGEVLWAIGDDGLLKISNVFIPDRAWFLWTNGGELRLRTLKEPQGMELPDRKFWSIQYGQTHDFQHWGIGLAHLCYWPIYFKKPSLRWWALFLQKFGMPTMMGKYPAAYTDDMEKMSKLLQALAAIGVDSAVAVPEDVDVSPVESARSGAGADSYDMFLSKQNEALTRIILTQTMTSTAEASGLGSGQAEVHEDKGLNVAQSDSDMLHESFNDGPVRWVTEQNFPGAAIPRVYRKLQKEDSIDEIVERDTKLEALGWVRTEESAKEVYGEGYERKPEPELPPAMAAQQTRPGLPAPNAQNDDDDGQLDQRQMDFANQFAARDPMPLYISRPVTKGGRELLAWARSQGFTDLQDESELHVTVLYSRAPVPWFDLARDGGWTSERVVIEEGGPRAVEVLGDMVVLHFADWEIENRHRNLVDQGASHDFPSFQPHVSFAKSLAGVDDLSQIETFKGELEFGPEVWEQLDADGVPQMPMDTVAFTADRLDAIDALAAQLSDQGAAAIQAMVQPVRDVLEGQNFSDDPEGLRVALLQALEGMDTTQFAEAIGDSAFAVRAAEESGEGIDAVT